MAGQGNGNKTDAQLAKIAAREDWFKLVVKIINWKDGNPESGSTALGCKITSKEWNAYTKGCLANHLINGKESAINTLKLTKQKIQTFGGFE
jgi:hypothetical protein